WAFVEKEGVCQRAKRLRHGVWVPAFAGTTRGGTGYSRRLRGFEQAPPPQQRVGLRLAAAEGDIGILRVARAARRIDVVVQAFGGGGIEDVAGLLEGAERVGVHHLRPHVAVIAR